MILTKQEILMRLGSDIVITPYNERNLNPNSYNLTLGDKILTYNVRKEEFIDNEYVYSPIILDPKHNNPYEIRDIPADGMVLYPGELYLAQTEEHTETHNLVPLIEGRSSFGRLGLFVHITAGFGDIGFCGHWTLELSVIRPLRIYPGLSICQIFYHTVQGACEPYKSDKYQHNKGVQPSMLWKEFLPKDKDFSEEIKYFGHDVRKPK